MAVTAQGWKGFKGAQAQSKAQLLTTFENWCAGKALPDSKYKRNEGRAVSGGRSILRQAFGAPGVRLYGWIETFDGVEAFILVECDANKKQQKADQSLLKDVGVKAFALQAEIQKGLSNA